ncbi:cytochrome P450 [Roridomyces roridus]|uniref:Cytochrome P450 n=1 Tax=Roridomyces roridus TaxID=1738132 RepID=A0AAD7BZZ8_9AGAR|nr:cytochrome P450 [Roridomyces roridus]
MLQLLLSYRYGDYEFGWQKLYGALYRVKGCISQPHSLQIIKAIDTDTTETVDMSPLLSAATLSAITEAVLGCKTQDLGELVEITTRVLRLAVDLDRKTILFSSLGTHLPRWVWKLLTLIPNAALDEVRKGRNLSAHIGHRLAQEKVSAARQGIEPNDDVFSQILDPNQPHKTVSEEDVASQTSLILIAGQETSANTLAFGLLELAQNPEFQDSLRREIHSTRGHGSRDLPYNDMPLLNAFIKETLRLYPITALTERMVGEDTVLPLMESITTSTGERLSEVPLQKGQIIYMGIASYQRLEAIWGADAGEFKPTRWIEGTGSRQGAAAIGPYANLLTFFGGERTCLGWRFAILEMQVIICELVGKFSFAPPEGDVARVHGTTIIQPVIPDGKKGAHLCVTPIV